MKPPVNVVIPVPRKLKALLSVALPKERISDASSKMLFEPSSRIVKLEPFAYWIILAALKSIVVP